MSYVRFYEKAVQKWGGGAYRFQLVYVIVDEKYIERYYGFNALFSYKQVVGGMTTDTYSACLGFSERIHSVTLQVPGI